MVILVEGESLATYLSTTLQVLSPSFGALDGLIEDAGGITELDSRLGGLIGDDKGDSTFAIYDQDLYNRPGKVTLRYLPGHAFSYRLLHDFETIFPAWMLADALQIFFTATRFPSRKNR